MLNVLLAYRCPDEGRDDSRLAALPCGLPWLAAAAREAGAAVTVANLSRLGWKDVERYLAEAAPDLLAVSVFSASRRPSARLLRMAKKLKPATVTVAGGPHASALPLELLRRWSPLDALIPGEGERTFGELCRVLGASGPEALGQVPGLVTAEHVPEQLPPPVADLDSLPSPRGDLELAGVEPERDLRWVVVSRGRGAADRPRPPALRSSSRVAKEMLERRKRFGLIDFSLLGVGLLANRDIPFALAGELKNAKAGASWELRADPAELQPDGEAARDRDRLRRGLEAAAAEGLRRVRFDLRAGAGDLETQRRLLASASETLRAAGIRPVASLLLGEPELRSGEELDELRALLRALRPAAVEPEPRLVYPGHPEVPSEAWFEEERAVMPEAGRPRHAKVAEAIEPSVREVLRESRLGPRELEARRVRGQGPWLEIDWGDYRAAAGDGEEAERHYRRAAELEPWNAHPWLRLAELARRRPGLDERATLREVLHRVPQHAAARERLQELRGEGGERRARGRKRKPRP